MQISQSDLVWVRRAKWRVADVRAYDRCRLLTLVGAGPSNRRIERRVLWPFDDIVKAERSRRTRFVSRRVWTRACRALAGRDMPPDRLRSALGARIDLLPHQLEPALALIRGLGTRVLLADEVGLGKTIQAGLIISELRLRGAADRVLIAAPAGLRDQWIDELRRFNLPALVADVRGLNQLAASIAVGDNPWTAAPIAVTSIDYVKRPDVLADVAACHWDLLVVDEAHGVTGDSDRRSAVASLARQVPFVLLVSATPHSGDRQAFAALCAIGSIPDREESPLLIFRRSREDVGLPLRRHVRRLLVRPTVDEARMHAHLRAYVEAVRREHSRVVDPASDLPLVLALSVLQKRACSSARSLERTVARRLQALQDGTADVQPQLLLPFDDPAGELTREDAEPAWSPLVSLRDRAQERRLLEAIHASALQACHRESKIAALRRFLRRIKEPVVIFTEYRDTLAHVQALVDEPSILLHGALSRDDRREALSRFAAGSPRILLATDAAGEGINLQQACRIVINFELPWSPTRLEQRIGRVDRIGQLRTVHAVHLVDRSNELEMLARLRARIARVHADVSAPDPLDSTQSAAPGVPRDDVYGLKADAHVEAARLSSARCIFGSRDGAALERIEEWAPCRGRVSHWRTRAAVGNRRLTLWRAETVDATGRVIDAAFIAVLATHAYSDREELCVAAIEHALAARRLQSAAVHRAFVTARIARERAIASIDLVSTWRQPGLFDRRSERARLVAESAQRAITREQETRIALLERSVPVSHDPPVPLLALFSR